MLEDTKATLFLFGAFSLTYVVVCARFFFFFFYGFFLVLFVFISSRLSRFGILLCGMKMVIFFSSDRVNLVGRAVTRILRCRGSSLLGKVSLSFIIKRIYLDFHFFLKKIIIKNFCGPFMFFFPMRFY